MNVLLLMVLTASGYVAAYHTYGRLIATKVFKINPNTKVPSETHYDGKEYVPSDRQVMFGHHF